MKWIYVNDYREMSEVAASFFLEEIKRKQSITLGLATGGTPIGFYEALVRDHVENHTSYHHVSTFNLDEYIGVDPTHESSYAYYMNHHLFSKIQDIHNTHVPNGMRKDLSWVCSEYERLIKQHGGIDIQLLGLGANGHIAFNEPGTSFNMPTHAVSLTDSTRQANARFFDTIEEVPTHAISMGISTILQAKKIILLVSGESKKEVVQHLLEGVVTEDVPASALLQHPNVICIVDKGTVGSIE